MAFRLQGYNTLMAHFIVPHFIADKVVHGAVFMAEAVQHGKHKNDREIKGGIKQCTQIVEEQGRAAAGENLTAVFQHHQAGNKNDRKHIHHMNRCVIRRLFYIFLVDSTAYDADRKINQIGNQ